MTDQRRYPERRRGVLLVLAVALLAGVLPGSADAAPVVSAPPVAAQPDPEVMRRLKSAAAPGSDVLLIGGSVDVGVARPERVFLPVAVFNTSRDRVVTVHSASILDQAGRVRVSRRYGQRLRRAVDAPGTAAAALGRVADRNRSRAAAFLRQGLVLFDDGLPVVDLALADGSTTTFTVRVSLSVGSVQRTLALPLTVSVAALPSVAYWYAGDGHVHSTWSDGLYPLSSQVAKAKYDGQRFIIMTDHWKGIWSIKQRGDANWTFYHDDCAARQTAFGIPVLPGVEVMTAGDDGHVLGYALDRTAVPPRDVYLAPQALLDAVNRHSGGTSFGVVAHPFQQWPNEPWADWSTTGFRAIELMSNERVASDATIAAWFALLRRDAAGAVAGNGFTVGLANSDDHFNSPGGAGINWVRSTVAPLSRTAVWEAIRLGRVSASGGRDFGSFTLNGVQQGGVAAVSGTGTLTFTVLQRPVTGRACMEISIRDKNNSIVWSVSNPASSTYTRSIPAPLADGFYTVRMVFAKRDGSDRSHVWCNPVFLDRR